MGSNGDQGSAYGNDLGSPTAVALRSFTAARSNAGVVVRWRSASEVGVLGYHVFREQHGKRVKMNRALISIVSGRTTKGHTYSWLDRTAPRPAQRSGTGSRPST